MFVQIGLSGSRVHWFMVEFLPRRNDFFNRSLSLNMFFPFGPILRHLLFADVSVHHRWEVALVVVCRDVLLISSVEFFDICSVEVIWEVEGWRWWLGGLGGLNAGLNGFNGFDGFW